MTLGKPWLLPLCPFSGISLGVLKDDSGPTMVRFSPVFCFAWLLLAIPLRININVQSIDENQEEGIKEWEKQKASFTMGNNERVYMCFCF